MLISNEGKRITRERAAVNHRELIKLRVVRSDAFFREGIFSGRRRNSTKVNRESLIETVEIEVTD